MCPELRALAAHVPHLNGEEEEPQSQGLTGGSVLGEGKWRKRQEAGFPTLPPSFTHTPRGVGSTGLDSQQALQTQL